MKNIFDTLKSGNLSDIGNTLSNTLSNNFGSTGESIKGAVQSGTNAVQNNLGGLGGLLGSAAVGGLLGALFTGKSTKKIAKGTLMAGGTAAAGALAWKFFQKWSQTQVQEDTTTPPSSGQNYQSGQTQPTAIDGGWTAQPQQALPPADNTALLLLEAMVFAARADGHIDDEEKTNIHNAVQELFPGQEMTTLLDNLLQKPIDPMALAQRVTNVEEAHDLYRLSCAAITVDSFMERSYLDGLAQALRIDATYKVTLEQEAEAAKTNASV